VDPQYAKALRSTELLVLRCVREAEEVRPGPAELTVDDLKSRVFGLLVGIERIRTERLIPEALGQLVDRGELVEARDSQGVPVYSSPNPPSDDQGRLF
jgi:hypothetical protein